MVGRDVARAVTALAFRCALPVPSSGLLEEGGICPQATGIRASAQGRLGSSGPAVARIAGPAGPTISWSDGASGRRPGVAWTSDAGGQARSGKKRAISRSADSGASEPWIRFSPISMARSPRMVPGAASTGLVAPIRVRTTL